MERNRHLALVLLVILALSGGCVTAQPTVSFTTDNSAVFADISTADAWGTSSVSSSVTLAPGATTTEGVTSLLVVSSSGSSFYSTTVDPGQTSVTLPLPTGAPATIVATNTVNGTTVGNATVRVGGTVYP